MPKECCRESGKQAGRQADRWEGRGAKLENDRGGWSKLVDGRLEGKSTDAQREGCK